MKKYIALTILALLGLSAAAQRHALIAPPGVDPAAAILNQHRELLDEPRAPLMPRPARRYNAELPQRFCISPREQSTTTADRLLSYKSTVNGATVEHFLGYDEYGVICRDSTSTGECTTYERQWREPGTIWSSKTTRTVTPEGQSTETREERTFHPDGSVATITVKSPQKTETRTFDENGYLIATRTVTPDGEVNIQEWVYFAPGHEWINLYETPTSRKTLELDGERGYYTHEGNILPDGTYVPFCIRGNWYDLDGHTAGSFFCSWRLDYQTNEYVPYLCWGNRTLYEVDENNADYVIGWVQKSEEYGVWNTESKTIQSRNYTDPTFVYNPDETRYYASYRVQPDGELALSEECMITWANDRLIKFKVRRPELSYDSEYCVLITAEGKRSNIVAYYDETTGGYMTTENSFSKPTLQYPNYDITTFTYYDANHNITATIRQHLACAPHYRAWWEQLIDGQWQPCADRLQIRTSSTGWYEASFDEDSRLVEYKLFSNDECVGMHEYEYTQDGFICRSYRLGYNNPSELYMHQELLASIDEQSVETITITSYYEDGSLINTKREEFYPDILLTISSYLWNGEWVVSSKKLDKIIEYGEDGSVTTIKRGFHPNTGEIVTTDVITQLTTPTRELEEIYYYDYYGETVRTEGQKKESILLEQPRFEVRRPIDPVEQDDEYFFVTSKTPVEEVDPYAPLWYKYDWKWDYRNNVFINYAGDPPTWEIADELTLIYHRWNYDKSLREQVTGDETIRVNSDRMMLEHLLPAFNVATTIDGYSALTYAYDHLGRMTLQERENTLTDDHSLTEYVYGPVTITGLDKIAATAATFTVYNLQGICLLRDAPADALAALPHGLYIINGIKTRL